MGCGAPLASSAGPPQRRKIVTVLFSDLVGSTALGERLDPEALREVIRRYFLVMRVVIERHGGVVERLFGDGVLGVFGLPLVREDDAWRAVRAAVGMRDALIELNATLSPGLGGRLAMRTGVNTGEVLVGYDELDRHLSGGIVGDAVNVASRLEAAAGPDEILLGESTYRLVRDRVRVDGVELSLKGKSGMVSAHRAIGLALDGRAGGRRLAAPVIGRERELEAGIVAFEEAVAGSVAVLVSVIGDAGTGKSRLVRELVGAVESRARVLSGRCLPYDEGTTFWPLAEIVCQAVGTTPDDHAGRIIAALTGVLEGECGEIAGVVASRLVGFLGLGPLAGAAEEGPNDLVLLLRALTVRSPLVLVLEDVYFAKPPLLDLVEQLALLEVPVLLLCTARPELLDAHQNWGASLRRARTIELGPLDERDCETLLSALLGQGPATSELLPRVLEVAGGNPLVVEELLGMLIDDGDLRREPDGPWTLVRPLDALRIPPTIGAILSARLDLLGESERELLECAAVVGKEFLYTELRALTAEQVELDAPLASLLAKQLIELDERHGSIGYEFHHILVRDATYGAISKRRRGHLHEHYADHLERASGGERDGVYGEIVGTHLEHACRLRRELGDPGGELQVLADRGAARFADASRRAFGTSDFPAASRLGERGIELHPADDRLRAQLLIGLGQAMADLGNTIEAISVFKQAASAAASAGAETLRLTAEINTARQEAFAGLRAATDALETVRGAIAALEPHGDGRALAQAWNQVADLLSYAGRDDEAFAAAQRGLEHARTAGDTDLHYHHVAICFSAVHASLPVDEGLRLCQEALAVAHPGTIHTALLQISHATLTAMTGDFVLAREQLAEASKTCETRRLDYWVAIGKSFGGKRELLAGDFTAAEAYFHTAREILTRDPDASLLSECVAWHAVALARCGHPEAATDAALLAGSDSLDYDVQPQIVWRLAHSLASQQLGDPSTAENLAREAAEIATRTQGPHLRGDALACLGEILLRQGRGAEAAPILKQAISHYERKGIVPAIANAHRLLDEARVVPEPRTT